LLGCHLREIHPQRKEERMRMAGRLQKSRIL
jgi:hypothetical protein